MTIEAALLLSAASVAISLIFGLSNWKRANRRDAVQDTTQLTTVIVKLENISEGLSEIKAEMKTELKGVKSEVQELRERVAKVESSTSSAHHRLDTIDVSKRRENMRNAD